MEAKHTPGPWTANEENCGGGLNVRADSGVIVGHTAQSRSRDGSMIITEEAKANARLIAASPTLRDFVQRVANQTRETMGGCAGLVDDARDLLKTLA